MKIRIVIDSTADVSAEIKRQVTVVPLTILFGDEEYIDGVTINHKTFYKKLIESDVLPVTSQPTPDAFAKIYQEAKNAGDSVVVLTISSQLSGTYQSATLAAQDYPENVYIVDSKNVALASGILAEYAVQMANAGLSAKDIAQNLTEAREKVHLIAMLDTLEYLKRGGRISKTVAFAGSLLSIQPVICIRGTSGEIEVIGKARGSRQGNNLLVKEIEAAGGVDFTKPLMLGYTGLSDHLLQKYIEDSAALWQEHTKTLPVTVVGSVVGTHAGPGAVAVAFFKP